MALRADTEGQISGTTVALCLGIKDEDIFGYFSK